MRLGLVGLQMTGRGRDGVSMGNDTVGSVVRMSLRGCLLMNMDFRLEHDTSAEPRIAQG